MKRFWLLSAALLTAGCGSLLPRPAVQPMMCVLTPVDTFAPTALPTQEVSWHLAVDIPSGGASYDTTRLPVMRKSQTIEYFSGIEWTDRLPILLQSLIIKSFENTGKIMGVSRSSAGINPDRMLTIDIRQCHVTLKDGAPQVDVALMVKLVDMADRRILASTLVSSSVPMPSMDTAVVVRGFQQTVNDVIQQIVTWSLKGGTAPAPAKPQSA